MELGLLANARADAARGRGTSDWGFSPIPLGWDRTYGNLASNLGFGAAALAKEGVEASLEGTQGITGVETKRLAHGQGLTGRLPK
jgi:hypothetical protein